jgi:Tfp pilus assembly protein PilN
VSALPNLASRPFINRRPVQRLALLLWLAGGASLVANALLYWRYVTGAGRRHEELTQIAADAERERAALTEQQEALSGIDLEWQSEQVRFLDYKIAERTFSWSELFDQLADVLPRGVRLSRLQPSVAQAETSRRRLQATYGESVGLAMNGAAESGEDVYAFVDALFGHQAFAQPSLSRETRGDEEVEFNLTVTYLPGAVRSTESLATAAAGGVEPALPAEPGAELAPASIEVDPDLEKTAALAQGSAS